MTADPRLLPAGISDDRSQALLELIERLGGLDLTPILAQRVDSTAADALMHLAWQYHVMGLEGFSFAATDDERRELLRSAIALHRQKGTPDSVRAALLRLGFTDVTVRDPATALRHDGTYHRNGEIRRTGVPHWTFFDLVLATTDAAPAAGVPAAALLQALVAAWKPARSTIGRLAIQPATDDVLVTDDPITLDVMTELRHFDGSFAFDGSVDLSGAGSHAMETLA